MKQVLCLLVIIHCLCTFSQVVKDSLAIQQQTEIHTAPTLLPKSDSAVPIPKELGPTREINTLQNFAGSLNALFHGEQLQGSFDLSVETYHYFLITGRRYKNDSIHQQMLAKKKSLIEVYKGFHMYMINRAAMDFDTLKAIANNYLTSLVGSPLTARFCKDFFLTKARAITASSFTPVLAIRLTGDGRLIPYNDRERQLHFGASSHFYVSLLTSFRRLELDVDGREIDNGTMYLKPVIGIAYGTHQLMASVTPGDKILPIITSGCRLGFRSEMNKIKDFSFFMNYTLTDILGPKLRAGVLLGANKLN